KPYPLFPGSTDTVSANCLLLKADGFFDLDDDGHGASQWQISTDSANFSNPLFDSWKQYANWYNEINLQANDDLTDEEFSNLPPSSTLWWRVRYRDKGLEWSPWSTRTKFYTRSLELLSGNLVTNPGAETGINNWTATTGVIESLSPNECNGISPYQGQKYFAVGALCVEFPFASAYQNISVADHATGIDSGNILVHYGGYLADWQNTDRPSFALQFLNAAGQVITSTDTINHQQSAWTIKQNSIAVPVGTRIIRFIVMGTRFAGADNDSYFDNLFLELFSGDFSCSYYQSPGELHGRIYVDKNAIAFPDGESWLTAFRTLGEALNKSNADSDKHEIWIAEGTYHVTNENQRDSSFHITRAVDIYGSFAGVETTPSQRIIDENPTLLSGEIADTTILEDNCYHVINIENTSDTMTLDGLNICCGYSDGLNNETGGGIYISNTNTKPIFLDKSNLYNNYAIAGSSIFNSAELRITGSSITSSVIEGTTGSSILNSGLQVKLFLKNSFIRQVCSSCPEVIKNQNGALLFIDETVNIERE
ncbi:MAG TPA: hypothetical protein VMZ69_01660, partial [Saprospiraceae bacterium]|nr:hypothetical protein [Saprospiraceae bacterium]